MNDLVEREAVLRTVVEQYSAHNKLIPPWLDFTELPSVTQKSETVTEFADRCRECGAKYGKLLEQKSGKWIHFAQSDDCSECGWSTGKYISPSKFCPNCGARMFEPQESEDKG